ncbi:50S ribosomal protein L6 [Candidatus Dojkabacteria bacterium]|nr:50S ribosomal protein L6 [Candidatus Dojkabacteria bacterium]
MSRIGIKPITIPEGVNVSVDNNILTVKGPKGELTFPVHDMITVSVNDKSIEVARKNDQELSKAMHGTTRSIIKNMVEGVVNGYQKVLLIQGIGYRASLNGKDISLSIGYTHPVEIIAPEGITFSVEDSVKITISGIDKQLVGETAAKIRAVRKPEPYKGKGIRYENEYVRRKTPRVISSE